MESTITNGAQLSTLTESAAGSRTMGKAAIIGIIAGAVVATAVGIYGVIKLCFKKDEKPSDEKKGDEPKAESQGS